jgi:Golgi nucleoside diphosphatase
MSTHFAVTTAESKTSDQHDDSYGIIMDGGSTGTKLKVYKWNHRTSGTLSDRQDSKPGVVRNLQLVKSTKFKPGISQIAGKPDELKGYLDTIMQNAVKEVPKDKHSDTPIYFMATAGNAHFCLTCIFRYLIYFVIRQIPILNHI